MEGLEGSGEISYYLKIKLEPTIYVFSLDKLTFLIENEYFRITADSLELVGDTKYNKEEANKLTEEGKILVTETNTIEYLVYKAPESPPEGGGEFTLTISSPKTVLEYSPIEQSSSNPTTKPLTVLSKETKSQKVTIPKIEGTQKAKLALSNSLNSSVTTTKYVGGATSVVSPMILYNALGILVKFFQIVEVLSNLALMNTQLGRLITNVIDILGSLKFPIKLPSDFFWPKYQEDSRIYFWKSRHQLSVHERELFILCNETLTILLYLLSWVVWSVLIIFRECLNEKSRNSEDQSRPLKFDKDRNQNENRRKEERVNSSMNELPVKDYPHDSKNPTEKKLTKDVDKLFGMSGYPDEENFRSAEEQEGKSGDQLKDNNELLGLIVNSKRQNSGQGYLPDKENEEFHLIGSKRYKNGFNERVEQKETTAPIVRENQVQSTTKLQKLINLSKSVKQFLFLMVYFDAQFITINELLHSDLTLFDKIFSRPSLSYFISFVTLCLMTVDLWTTIESAVNLSRKISSHVELTNQEKKDAEQFFDDINTEGKTTSLAMNFNLISILRFTVYQIIIASMQLSPNFQTGLLFILQLIFFVLILNESRKAKIFSNRFIFARVLIFEGCILVFTLLSFIFSFENSHSWFSSSVIAVLQTLAAVLILVSVFVEFLTLVIAVLGKLTEILKEKCSKKKNLKIQNKKIWKSDECQKRIFDEKDKLSRDSGRIPPKVSIERDNKQPENPNPQRKSITWSNFDQRKKVVNSKFDNFLEEAKEEEKLVTKKVGICRNRESFGNQKRQQQSNFGSKLGRILSFGSKMSIQKGISRK